MYGFVASSQLFHEDLGPKSQDAARERDTVSRGPSPTEGQDAIL